MTNQANIATLPGLEWLKGLGREVVDLLFPPHCVACNRFGGWLCASCVQKIDVIQAPTCRRCGLPLAGTVATEGGLPVCPQCCNQTSQLDGVCAFAFHGGPLREAIHQFKYRNLRDLAAPLGRLLSEGWATLPPNDLDVDIIVPVPLHASRFRERGYNQAALLARELGRHLERPVVEKVLVRVKDTIPQVGLDAQARRANVHNAFQCVNGSLAGKRALLLDDVYTTGSTLEAAADALRREGVSSIWAYTLARAR
jgi:ComF family protein